MSEATRFFNNLAHKVAMVINTAMPCKVLSFDESTSTAKIQPLFMVKEVGKAPEALSPIEGVPVLGMRYKIKSPYGASISGLVGVHGPVDGSNSVIAPKQEIEYVPFLKKGDIVYAVFAQRALDNVLGGKVAYPEINRHHDTQDAVIVGLM